MLTTEQSTLLALIRSALWGTEQPENPEIGFDAAKIQGLVPLAFPESAEAKFCYMQYIRVLYAQNELLSLMGTEGIHVAILKGTAAAIYYPNPIQRAMGDIDLIVSQSKFEAANKLMGQSGYQWKTGDANDPGIREIAYNRNGITFELHHHFSSKGIGVEKYIIRGLDSLVSSEIDGYVFPMLPPLENGLVLLAHIAQHLRSGLGLRQIIDWMMYVHAQLADETWETTFRPAAADCGLEDLAITATRLCQKYLGLPDPITWCDGADEKLVDDLLENLLVSGNFGQVHGAGSSVEKVATNIKRTGLFRYLQQQGERNWKAYQEHKALKPLCWAYQIGRYIHRGLGTGRSSIQLAEDYTRSQARYDLLTRLGID